ncbi:MAG: ABC transporter permease [Cyanothece sp. SIO1E1]|nr:ABC transporter permease [Cyanothece sp. SIO1E1]
MTKKRYSESHFWLRQLPLEWLGLVVLLIVWQLGAIHYGTIILPTPSQTLTSLAELLFSQHLLRAIGVTIWHLVAGFGFAALLGIVLGTMAAIQPPFYRAIAPVITGLQGVPPIAWIVLALLWFGSGGGVPIFTVAVATLPIIFLGAVAGGRTVSAQLLEMAQAFEAPSNVLLQEIYLPHLGSYVFPALAAGIGVAWRVAVMSELLASELGIGARLNLARINLDTPEVMAWIVVVVVLTLISEHWVLRPLQRLLEPWQTPGISSRSAVDFSELQG